MKKSALKQRRPKTTPKSCNVLCSLLTSKAVFSHPPYTNIEQQRQTAEENKSKK